MVISGGFFIFVLFVGSWWFNMEEDIFFWIIREFIKFIYFLRFFFIM